MENTLITYLNKRVSTNHPDWIDKPAGPVITISREVGCSALELAYALMNRLNKSFHRVNWKVLSKEIFNQSAMELNLDPDKVAKIFKQVDRTTFDEILNSFNEKRFKSEKKIRNTVIDVIRSFAEDGFCIIVGRASNIIAADIKNSLHIRLVAPSEFRIKSIMQKNHLGYEEAKVFIFNEEKDRFTYRQAVMGKHQDESEIFDLTFNRDKFTTENIVDLVMLSIEQKEILHDYKRKLDFF